MTSLLPGMDLAISCMVSAGSYPFVPAITRTGICKEKLLRINMRYCVTISPSISFYWAPPFRKQRYQGNHQIPHNNGKLNGIFTPLGNKLAPVQNQPANPPGMPQRKSRAMLAPSEKPRISACSSPFHP